jgi:hypothetical protein
MGFNIVSRNNDRTRHPHILAGGQRLRRVRTPRRFVGSQNLGSEENGGAPLLARFFEKWAAMPLVA